MKIYVFSKNTRIFFDKKNHPWIYHGGCQCNHILHKKTLSPGKQFVALPRGRKKQKQN
jgi:hypothetical protein